MPKKIKINKKKFVELRKEGMTIYEVAKELGIGERSAERFYRKLKDELSNEDLDIINQNVKLAKQKQKIQDLNRIERKSFRDYARLENAIEELHNKILRALDRKKIPSSKFKKTKINPNTKVGAIVHLTDLHFNELINLSFNRYDFKIASKRLKKFINNSIKYLKSQGVKDVCLVMTGDLLNSDRRLDEILSEATNRAKALVLSVGLLEQVILELQKYFNVTIANVIGNESRITEDIGWVEEVASDNYDYIIYQFLKKIFSNSKIKFLDGSATEQVIEIVGQNVLILHGNQVKSTSLEKEIQRVKGKWMSQGIKIDFVLLGHLHCCRISDTFARGSSLAGGNAYSNDALQLESRASQNIHIFYNNGNRDSIKIDLQNVEGVDGYEINEALESYNAKSLKKAKKKTVVNKVVI